MNISLNYLRTSNLLKNNILILCVIFFAIMTGLSIARGNLLYFGVMLIPLMIYLFIIKPFIFPFGLYVLLIPFDAVLTVIGDSQGTTLTKILGILTILSLLFKGVFEKKLRWPNNAAIWWILFVSLGIASLLWAIQADRVLRIAPTAIGLLILYLIASSYKINKDEFNIIRWCIIAGGLLAAIYTIYFYFIESNQLTRVTMTIGKDRTSPINYYAVSLIIPSSMCAHAMMQKSKKIIKIAWGVLLCLIVFAVVITGSRGGLLGTVIAIVINFYSTKNKIASLSFLVVIGTIIVLIMPDIFIERWKEAIAPGSTGSNRTLIWYVGIKALGEYWPIGAGLNNFSNVTKEYGHYVTYLRASYGAHNIYIGFLIELGIVGLSFMMLAFWKHYKLIRSKFDQFNADAIMLRGCFWGGLTSSFFVDTFYLKSFWLIWMIILMQKNILNSDVANRVSSA